MTLHNFAYYGNWRASVVMSTLRGNRREATEAIEKLYEEYGRLKPWVVWCEGPFQLGAMHSIVPKVIASEQWETISRYFKHNIYPETDWSEQWDLLYNKQIEPLLRQARDSMSRAYYSDEIIESLAAHLRVELDRRLRAEARGTDEVRTTVRRELRNTAGYQHLGLKLTSAILKRTGDRRIGPDDDESARLTTEQCTRLQTVMHEAMRLHGGILAEIDAMIIWGAWSLPWLDRYLYGQLTGSGRVEPIKEELEAFVQISQNTLGVLCTEGLCFACDKPIDIEIDERRRPHNSNGPAITFNDGFTVHALEGVAVNKRIVEAPDQITSDMIHDTRNAEQRRIMMQIYGIERFLQEGHAQLISQDECGQLYEIMLPPDRRGMRLEPLVFVRVRNSTPEPDGSFKFYTLRVPPRVRSAREAVAWTFGMRAGEYAPQHET